jgi:hypothetical protein
MRAQKMVGEMHFLTGFHAPHIRLRDGCIHAFLHVADLPRCIIILLGDIAFTS